MQTFKRIVGLLLFIAGMVTLILGKFTASAACCLWFLVLGITEVTTNKTKKDD